MEFNLPALIGISTATMFFGYFFGLFEGRGQGYKKGRKEEAEGRAHLPTVPEVVPPKAAGPLEPSLLTLRRDDAGEATVLIDGQPVAASKITPSVRKRLIDLMVMLRPWIEPAYTPPSASARPTAEQRLPTTEGRHVPGAATVNDAVVPPASPASLSLVQQIDMVLQERLAGTPLASRGIRVAEALHGGAIVFIGQAQYDGVDKVPDSEVQSAIRAAIAEWERRFTPT